MLKFASESLIVNFQKKLLTLDIAHFCEQTQTKKRKKRNIQTTNKRKKLFFRLIKFFKINIFKENLV
jgi:hypothetical protein